MREQHGRDLKMLLELQLDGNERVRTLVTAYEARLVIFFRRPRSVQGAC